MSRTTEKYQVTKHVCPRNCYGTCTMTAYTKNGKLEKLEGDPTHEYSQGKICAKGYSYIDQVYHHDRIKYPLLQTNRGSGNWKQISWEHAMDIIASKMLELNERYGSNRSLCLNKHSGNMGILHNSPENLFDALGETTRATGSLCWSAGLDAQYYDFGNAETSEPSDMQNSKLIILWGVNPAWTAVHSLPYIYKAQDNGAKVVVIDPIYTASAKKADYYIQVKPGSDGALALAIAKILIDTQTYNHAFIIQHTYGWEDFHNYVHTLNLEELSFDSGVHMDTIIHLANMMSHIHPMFIWLGFGLQRHINGGQNIRAIHALSALTGNIGIPGSGVNYAHQGTWNFNTTLSSSRKHDNRFIDINQFSEGLQTLNDPPVKFLWLSCRNILNQDPQTNKLLHSLQDLELIVTVDHYLTSTAQQSDLVLPTTTFFEEEDVVAGYWHHFIGMNQKAIDPYYESKSDLEIAKLLSQTLNQKSPGFCSFPVEGNSSEFIEKEFNEELYELLDLSHWSELKNGAKRAKIPQTAWEGHVFKTPSKKFEFYSAQAKKNGHAPLAQYHKGMTPTKPYPYWLLTTHSQHGLNSQFSNFSSNRNIMQEPIIFLSPATAKVHGITAKSMINVFNDLDEIEIMADISNDLPEDILLFHQGWFSESKIIINKLVPGYATDMGEVSTGSKGIAFYDTFVNIKK